MRSKAGLGFSGVPREGDAGRGGRAPPAPHALQQLAGLARPQTPSSRPLPFPLTPRRRPSGAQGWSGGCLAAVSGASWREGGCLSGRLPIAGKERRGGRANLGNLPRRAGKEKGDARHPSRAALGSSRRTDSSKCLLPSPFVALAAVHLGDRSGGRQAGQQEAIKEIKPSTWTVKPLSGGGSCPPFLLTRPEPFSNLAPRLSASPREGQVVPIKATLPFLPGQLSQFGGKRGRVEEARAGFGCLFCFVLLFTAGCLQ